MNRNRQFWRQIFFILLVLLGMSLPLSRFTMSAFQIFLAVAWLLDGLSIEVIGRFFRKCNPIKAAYHTIKYIIDLLISNLIEKFRLFLHNRTALILASLFGLHLLGLIHTSDFEYAMKDLRTKLPLILMPLMLASMPQLSRKQIHILLICYILAVFGGTIISMIEYLKQDFEDIRKISKFISPVRFSLNIAFSFFILSHLLIQPEFKKTQIRLVMLLLMAWFIVILVLLESGIGIMSILVVGFGYFGLKIIRAGSLYFRIASGILFLAIPIISVWYVYSQITMMTKPPDLDFSKLEKYTPLGEKYLHDTINFGLEDGKYTGIYMATNEMAAAWNKRSSIPFLGRDKANQLIQYTLIRYLTSKDLRKDAGGVNSLTEKDIHLIEKGIANVNYVENPSIRTRISKILVGYQQYSDLHDPNGSSVMQRFEHWKASRLIIKDQFWFGVGTGDLPAVFKETYERTNSPLKSQWRWRSHNQYLSIWIAFGVFGAIWFIIVLIYPLIINKNYRTYLFPVFLTIMMLSMLTEDTIETQDGVTLYAFFTSLFAISVAAKDAENTENHAEN